MNVVKMPGNTQVKVQASGNKTSAAQSSGDDFMKLLQSKQNVNQSQETESKPTEGGMVQNKVQQDSTKRQEDRIEEPNEDTSDDVLKKDISHEEILQQATLQQAAAQVAGVITQTPSQAQETLAVEMESTVPIENILTSQESQTELVTEQPVPQPDSKPIESVYQQKENVSQEPELKEKNPTYQDNGNQVGKPSQETETVKRQPEPKVQEKAVDKSQSEPKVQEKAVDKSQPEPKVHTREASELKVGNREDISSQGKAETDLEVQSKVKAESQPDITVVQPQIESQKEPEIEPQILDVSQKQNTPQQQENDENQGLFQEEELGSKAQKSQEILTQEGKKTGIEQEPGIQGIIYHSVSQPGEVQQISQETETFHLKTTESELPQDLGKMLTAKLSESKLAGNTLTVELEPASLGKLTIKLVYEAGRAAVSILASNPRTLEILNQRAAEIASILEEKTGQDTVIYTQPSQQQENQDTEQHQGGRGNQQDREEQHQNHKESQHQTESFAQQLRLGLI